MFYVAEILITFITEHYCSWFLTNTPYQSKSHVNMLSLWFSEYYYSLSSIISLSNVFDLMFTNSIKDFIGTLSAFKERLFQVSRSQNLLVSRWLINECDKKEGGIVLAYYLLLVKYFSIRVHIASGFGTQVCFPPPQQDFMGNKDIRLILCFYNSLWNSNHLNSFCINCPSGWV